MRVFLLPAFLMLAACNLFPTANVVEPTSSGQLTVRGDESWDTSLEGTGLAHVMGQTVCQLRLYDDSNFPADNANYGFAIGVGTGGLRSYTTGVFAQGTAEEKTVSGTFRIFTGPKNTEHVYTATGGTVTIDRFDAERITGKFELTGTRACYDEGKPTCTSTAMGHFDAKNEDCFPPLMP